MAIWSGLLKSRLPREYWRVVRRVGELENNLREVSDEELRERFQALRARLSPDGDGLDDILDSAFALTREVAQRALGERHFDVQLIGGVVLHEGKIAEMLTGEGKTLAATLAVALNALSGRGAHVVTVNDYLARRDAVWMGQIYHGLGLSVACITHAASYQYDPGYSGDQGEDGARDRGRDELGNFRVEETYLRPISRKEAYAADITYGTNHEFGFDFLRDNLAPSRSRMVQRELNFAIIDEVDSVLIDEARTPLIISAPDAESSDYYRVFARVAGNLKENEDYVKDEKLKTVNATDAGIEKVEKMLGIQNLFAPENARLNHFLNESLKARALFHRDKDYVVRDGGVIIVDEFTGRLLLGRRYSGGLHQAIEAKEGVAVREENRTQAQITIQNYFRLYRKVAGMTGTAATSAEEFHKVYNLQVVSIPPNKPVVRVDMPDVIYKTRAAKLQAIAREVKKRQDAGQPVLIGTASIEQNEVVSAFLAKAGVRHEILNAKNHEREAEIIAQAGRVGAVTVATNIAGRGVDIKLGGNPATEVDAEKVRALGGLHVLGSNRHESRRIDNQLRGRSGRQGDPGSSQFFLSLEDDLLRIFGGERLQKIMTGLRFPEDQPIESGLVSKAVNQAQAKVEGANLDLRKHLLDFDDVLSRQRAAVYGRRLKIMDALDTGRIAGAVNEALGTDAIPEGVEPERAAIAARTLVGILDTFWINHLEDLDSLRQSVYIRAYAQHDPLVEYRREAHALYRKMNDNFTDLTRKAVKSIMETDLEKIKQLPAVAARPPAVKKIGRNDPCYCGSGKKYKKCHGA